ncbi:ISNCY family transposase ISVbsp4 [Pseudoalteromonas holothuriae]|uniref:ISNCY family transposase ISVbsp4 n=1 Tax=Pseudoalteromonas holothuriae TaxID=2963714 RepID=A0ABN8UG17_9GAMM|nr:ISNCY family transposase ISVbsp4 [Pseudoalteromonas sp. CIP111951]
MDRAGIFGGPKRSNFSQMQRACEELGIEIIFASSPQGKGRIERAFDTLQDRLIPELRLNNINDMVSANSYLQHVFIPQFWHKKLTVEAKLNNLEYKLLPPHVNLDDICVIKQYRKIRNDHTFSYGNKFYFIESALKHSIANQKIEIRSQSQGKFSAYFAGRHLKINEVVEPIKTSMEDIEIQKKLDVLALADKLGNVYEASRLSGVSRDTIYRHRRLVKEAGIDALRRQEMPNHRHLNRTEEEIEKLVIEFSLQNPHLGQAQVSRQLKTNYSVEISPAGVRYIWLRENMNTAALRLAKLELLPSRPKLSTWVEAVSVATSKSLGNHTVRLPW